MSSRAVFLPALLLLLAGPLRAQEAGLEALAARPGRAALGRGLAAIASSGTIRGLAAAGRRVFYLKRQGRARQPVLYVADAPLYEPRPMLDVSRLSPDGSYGLLWWKPSNDGLLLAYGVTRPDAGDVELRVRDVDSALDLPDHISRAGETAAGVAWLPDRSAFYYVRLPRPDEAEPRRRVFLHTLGKDHTFDAEVFAGRTAEERPEPALSRDGRLLVVFARAGQDQGEILVEDLARFEPSFVSVSSGTEAAASGFLAGSTLYLLERPAASRGRVSTIDLRRPRKPRRRQLVAEGPFALADIALSREGLAVSALERASSRLRLHDRKGLPQREIMIPKEGGVTALAADPASSNLFCVWESFFAPPALYRYDARTSSLTVLDSVLGPPAEELKLARVDLPGGDGGQRSMFLVSDPWLKRDGERAVVLSMKSSRQPAPAFDPLAVSWAGQGGLWAVLVGPDGPADAQREAADLAAAGRWLLEGQYTKTGRLALLGRGPAAPAAAAAASQSPELFASVVLDRPEADAAAGPPPLSALILSSPCPGGPDPARARGLAEAWQSSGSDALLRWEPLGCQELPIARRLAEDLDIESFLLWKLGAEKPDPPPPPPPPPPVVRKPRPKK